MSGRRSFIREAWKLDPEGGLVVIPDEFTTLCGVAKLSPAERMSLVGLIRAWNPRVSAAPVVRASLADVGRWSGLSAGHQSDTLRELLDWFEPPLLRELTKPKRGQPRLLKLEFAERISEVLLYRPKRVPPAERLPFELSSAEREVALPGPNDGVPPAEGNSSAEGTQASLAAEEKEEEKKRDGFPLTDEELVALVVDGNKEAAEEWLRRGRIKRSKAKTLEGVSP